MRSSFLLSLPLIIICMACSPHSDIEGIRFAKTSAVADSIADY